MAALTILLKIMGATMLLLYAARMTRTGVERAAGPALRRMIARADRSALHEAAMGAGAAALLQSATAAALIIAGFAASGLIGTASALGVLLGADVGSAVAVQILSARPEGVIPALLALGGWLFLKTESRRSRQIGRALLGVALVLVALGMVSEAVAPLKAHPAAPTLAAFLAADPVSAFLAGAVFAFGVHSSIAAVLMLAAFTAQGLVGPQAAIGLLMGINCGGALIPVWLTRGMERKARLAPIGNFVFRAVGAAAALALANAAGGPPAWLAGPPERLVPNAHLMFNLALLALALPLARPMARLTERLIRERPIADPAALLRAPSALDPAALADPRRAIACAMREMLRIGGAVELMLRPAMAFFEEDRPEEAALVRRLGEETAEASRRLRLYLAEAARAAAPEESERIMDMAAFGVSLERAADVIARGLLEEAERKRALGAAFAPDDWAALKDVHERVLNNLRLAMNALVSGDIDEARQLIEEKDRLRALERERQTRHLERLRAGEKDALESGDIALETMRLLKEANSFFVSVAAPPLARSGRLRDTRLAPAED